MQGGDGGLGGRRTHLPRRGRYGGDLGRFQASQYKLGMHTTLNTQSPFCTYSPGALTPPTRLR